MQKPLIYLSLILLAIFGFSPFVKTETKVIKETETVVSGCQKLYKEIDLENIVDYNAFEQAIVGYNQIKPKTKGILTLIDFSKPSTEKRLFVIDINHKKLLFASHVAHGKNSGGNYATSFSNKTGSHKSSLGFYLTENTYWGNNGYSLRLNGLEKGINDNAIQRAIVIHGADYADPSKIEESGGRLGRSFGCPALPFAVNNIIINTIKGGSLLYIYADNKSYMAQSHILRSSSYL